MVGTVCDQAAKKYMGRKKMLIIYINQGGLKKNHQKEILKRLQFPLHKSYYRIGKREVF